MQVVRTLYAATSKSAGGIGGCRPPRDLNPVCRNQPSFTVQCEGCLAVATPVAEADSPLLRTSCELRLTCAHSESFEPTIARSQSCRDSSIIWRYNPNPDEISRLT